MFILLNVILVTLVGFQAAHGQTSCNNQCPTTIKQVCGSDGNTYTNRCDMKRAACQQSKNITVEYRGSCQSNCTSVSCRSQKVCQVIANKPRCVCRETCPTKLKQVCGSDGNTYNNRCEMKRAACNTGRKITVESQGSCPRPTMMCPDFCTALSDPVCGSDGTTYDNACWLEIERCRNNPQLTVSHEGVCASG